jgi:hypothetical protein
MLISVAELLKHVNIITNLKTRLTGKAMPAVSESSGPVDMRGNGGTCLHVLLIFALGLVSCQIHAPLVWKPKKKQPVASEGWGGTRGDIGRLGSRKLFGPCRKCNSSYSAAQV